MIVFLYVVYKIILPYRWLSDQQINCHIFLLYTYMIFLAIECLFMKKKPIYFSFWNLVFCNIFIWNICYMLCYVMLYVILCPGLEYNQIYLVSSSFSKFWIHAFLMLHVLDLAGVPLDQIINEHNKINKSNTFNKFTAS